MRGLVLLGVLIGSLGMAGCSEENPSDNAGSVSGPGVAIHCFDQTPRAIGDTNVRVACPTNTEPQ